jgi:hypothetical protein
MGVLDDMLATLARISTPRAREEKGGRMPRAWAGFATA